MDKNGKKLAFNLNVVSGYTDWITDVQLMASDLKKAGIKVTINTIEFDAYFNAERRLRYGDAVDESWPHPLLHLRWIAAQYQ